MPGLPHFSHGPTQAAISFSVSVKQHWRGEIGVKGNWEMIFFCNSHLTIQFLNKKKLQLLQKKNVKGMLINKTASEQNKKSS